MWERGPLGTPLHLLGTGERFTTRYGLIPMVEAALEPHIREYLPEGDVYAGDVLRALLFKDQEPEELWQKAGLMAGGVALGAAIDPLTYLGIGELTQAGRAAKTGGKLAKDLVSQARRGERALLALRSPIGDPRTALNIPLIRGGSALTELPFRAMGAFRKGRPLTSVAEHAGNIEPLVGAAKLVDRYMTSFLQKFGVSVGAHNTLHDRHKLLLSTLLGKTSKRISWAADQTEPILADMADEIERLYGIKADEAYVGLREVLDQAAEMVPGRKLVNGRFVYETPQGLPTDPALQDSWKIAKALEDKWGLPPSFGGPGSPLDHPLVRKLREEMIIFKRMGQNVASDELAGLGKEIHKWGWPGSTYMPSMRTAEADEVVRKRLTEILKNTPGVATRVGKLPSITDLNLIERKLRTVHPGVLAELEAAGKIVPGTKLRVPYHGRWEPVDPHATLFNDVGNLATAKSRAVVSMLYRQGKLSADEIGRLIPDLTIPEKNAYIRTNGITLRGKVVIRPEEIPQYFETEPAIMWARRGAQADRAILSKEYFDELKKMPDVLKKREQLTREEMLSWNETQVPELKGYYADSDAARLLNNLQEADLNPGTSLRGFMKGYGKALGLWSAWTLAIFPAYHFRNFVSNLWNLYLGSRNPGTFLRSIGDAHEAWRSIRKGTEFSITDSVTGKKYTAHEIWDGAAELALWNSGNVYPSDPSDYVRRFKEMKRWGSDDPRKYLLKTWKDYSTQKWLGPMPLPPTEAEELKLGWLAGARKVPGFLNIGRSSWYTEAGFNLASRADDWIKMAHVISRLKDGETLQQAVLSAKKYLGDFHALSKTERQILKPLMPFYAWSRFNIPFQLESLVRHPDKFARLQSALQSWEGEHPQEEKYLTDWMLDNFPLHIRFNKKTNQHEYFMLRNWLPAVDIYEVFHPIEFAMMSLTPFARVPLEQIFNWNFFTRSQVDRLSSFSVKKAIPAAIGGAVAGSAFAGGTGAMAGAVLGGVAAGGTAGEYVTFGGATVPKRLAHLMKSFRLYNTLGQMVDNPEQLTMTTQLMRIAAGRVYPLDTRRALWSLQQSMNDMRDAMNASIRSAVLRHHPEQIPHILAVTQRRRMELLRKRGLLEGTNGK